MLSGRSFPKAWCTNYEGYIPKPFHIFIINNDDDGDDSNSIFDVITYNVQIRVNIEKSADRCKWSVYMVT